MQVQQQDRVSVRHARAARRSRQPVVERIETPQRAAVSRPHIFPPCPVVRQLGFQSGAELGDIFAGMGPLHELLRGQRNEHADDDDPDFARELAPAVQRLWQMKMP